MGILARSLLRLRSMEQASAVPRVLVVDDEAVNLRLVQAYLQADGIATVGATNGEDALKRVVEGRWDLVLLDIRMPRMDGFAVCRKIREDPDNAQLPVIFLTAEPDDPVSEEEGRAAGANAYLHKPIHRHKLVACVRHLIERAQRRHTREEKESTSTPVLWL